MVRADTSFIYQNYRQTCRSTTGLYSHQRFCNEAMEQPNQMQNSIALLRLMTPQHSNGLCMNYWHIHMVWVVGLNGLFLFFFTISVSMSYSYVLQTYFFSLLTLSDTISYFFQCPVTVCDCMFHLFPPKVNLHIYC